MKILSINSVPYGSTCKMMTGICELALSKHDVAAATGFSTHPVHIPVRYVPIGGMISKATHMLLSRATGYNGVFSFFSTKKFLKQVKQMQPDVIHLHNLHGWYINIPMLFRYIKRNNIRIVWTLHDCWAFTGHCPYFTLANCDKWEKECNHCPSYKEYPQSLCDNARKMFQLKSKWFTGVKDLTIVTPSQWLAGLVQESFLKEYPVQVIHNGIDLSVFKPTQSDFRHKYAIPAEKKILLGVAFGWGERKGLDVFADLEIRLDKEKYQIVLVGTDDQIDKQLPSGIISIHRTQNQKELAEIYTAADLFVNPTREENYPTVNMEALACGTPVVSYQTGGSPEILDATCGSVVAYDDIDALEKEIKRICENQAYTREACVERAKQFDGQERFCEYIKLYESAK